MNNCGTGAEKVCRFVSTRFFECAQNDTVFYLRPKRTLILTCKPCLTELVAQPTLN